ncbi:MULTISPECIES: thioredoxin family protein [unclassified Myroides]|uniref:thioredoxin family protein n=1 Tax=unclassified Myroides TaxID=2642485 RepID=UPI0015FA5B25|nr:MULTISPECIES: thioredoxin family protein [unclassified Myroides]MBB1151269.1 thioredoxin family protein [Myroides sp. NP-2]MDM1407955.1 thioredoxin family protein [Myroides sp. DF42-4-2]
MKGISIGYFRRFIWLFLCLGWVSAQAQEVSFSNLEAKMQEKAKPIVVFLHTNWCNYCALMEKKTFSNSAVQQALLDKAYFVSFDAESKEKIQFKNTAFVYRKKGLQSGVHELAEALTSQNAYPALVFLNENYEIIYQHYAYVGPKEMLQLIEAL